MKILFTSIALMFRCKVGFILLLFVTFSNLAFSQENPTEEPQNEYINLIDTFNLDCITPPEGFEKYDGFKGYVHFPTRSSIVINVVKGRTIVDAEESLNDEYYKSNEVTLISKKEVVTDAGEDALLYKFSFFNKEEQWYRYSLFIGDLNQVLWINASYEDKYEKVVEEHIVQSLMTTKFVK